MKSDSFFWKLSLVSVGILIFFVLAAPQCPKICRTNDNCTLDNFCAKPVGQCAGLGVCLARPETCIEIYDPICGCDENTYDNSCFAAMAGVAVAYEGVCEPAGQCLSNEDCDSSAPEYCAKEAGDCEAWGECTDRPQECPLIYNPVCGCDLLDYDNPCFAAANGVNVLGAGLCTEVTCPEMRCGPPPLMPVYQCPDGSWAGPTGQCLRNPDNSCGWQIRECPAE